jgi:hypothetical protein
MDEELNESIWALNEFHFHAHISDEEIYLTESDYFDLEIEGKFKKLCNYLKEIPQKELDWYETLNDKFFMFDENVGLSG